MDAIVPPSTYIGKITTHSEYNSSGILEIPNADLADSTDLWVVHASSPVKLRLNSLNESVEPITVHTLFSRAVTRYGKAPVLAFKEDPANGTYTHINYIEYYQLCCQAARGFIKLGLQPYQTVAILGFNSVEWFISSLGAIFAGGITSGIYTTNSTEACYYVASHSKAAVIVVENNLQLEKILAVRDRLPSLKAIIQYRGLLENEDDMVYTWKDFMIMARDLPNTELIERLKKQRPNQCCSLIYTSGTTGNPKAVMLSHDNITYNIRDASEKLGLNPSGEFMVSYLPLSHAVAMICDTYFPFTNKIVIHIAQPDALRGSLGVTLKEVRPTMFIGVPRVWEKMQEKIKEVGLSITGIKKKLASWAKDIGYRGGIAQMKNEQLPWGWTLANYLVLNNVKKALGLDRCHVFYSGGAPMTRDTSNYFLSLGIKLKETYGSSETSGPQNMFTHDEYYMSSVGTEFEGSLVKLDNPDADGNGEICMYGRNIFMGYLEDEDQSTAVFDSDGYFYSGDVGQYEGKYLFITGRIKELIITSGGLNISPVQIEERILKNLPCLSNAMVIGNKRKYLSMLVTFKTVINADTNKPSDELTPAVQLWLQTLDCSLDSLVQLLDNTPETVTKAIQDGVDLANAQADSRAHVVNKWRILPREFSVGGGELGPTMKVRRQIVVEMYEDIIDEIYN